MLKNILITITTTTLIISSFFTQLLHAKENDTVTFLNSGKVAPANLPFSEAVRVGNTVYLSGQIGVLPGTLTLAKGGIEAETKQTMENIKITLEAHGLSMSNIVKCTVMMADMSKWSAFNKVYITYFEDNYPARSAFGTNGLAFNAQVEIECLAIDA